MAWCLLVAGRRGWAGLSKEMGALIAGVGHRLLPRTAPRSSPASLSIRDFFVTLFFVALGLRIPEPAPGSSRRPGLSLFVTSSRFAMYRLFAALHLDNRTAGVVAVNLAQVSEFSLVIFALGLSYGHISETANSLILYTMLMTALFSTYGILYNHAVATRLAGVLGRLGLRRWFGGHDAGADAGHGHGEGVEGDLFLLGVSREGLAFIKYLDRRDQALMSRVVAVDFNPETLERLTAAGVANHYGDISNPGTLRHTGIERAAMVISGISDWFLKGTSNLQILRLVRGLAPEARVIVTADSPESAQDLYAAGAAYVIHAVGPDRRAPPPDPGRRVPPALALARPARRSTSSGATVRAASPSTDVTPRLRDRYAIVGIGRDGVQPRLRPVHPVPGGRGGAPGHRRRGLGRTWWTACSPTTPTTPRRPPSWPPTSGSASTATPT